MQWDDAAGRGAGPTNALPLTQGYGECGITSGGTHCVASVKANGCHYNLGVREDVASHDGVAFSQSGEGTGRELGLRAEVQGVEYEWLGVCGSGEIRSDGIFSGNTTLAGEDEAGRPTGVWLGGEP